MVHLVIIEDHPKAEKIRIDYLEWPDKTLVNLIRESADGYLLEVTSLHEMIDVLIEVKRGGLFLIPKVTRLLSDLEKRKRKNRVQKTNLIQRNLTKREEEILQCLIAGLSYKGIADQLYLSVHTVNNHIRKIYKKLQVHTRGEAVAKATK